MLGWKKTFLSAKYKIGLSLSGLPLYPTLVKIINESIEAIIHTFAFSRLLIQIVIYNLKQIWKGGPE